MRFIRLIAVYIWIWILTVWERFFPCFTDVPPPELRYRVSGTPSLLYYFEYGKRAWNDVRSILADCNLNWDKDLCVGDYGCGCGRIGRYIDNYTYTGFDIDNDCIEWCRKYLNGNFVHASSFIASEFQIVLAISVFSHLPRQDFVEWLNKIKTQQFKGLIIFSVHGERAMNLHGLTRRIGELCSTGSFIRHSYYKPKNFATSYYTLDGIENLVEASGFRIVAFGKNGLYGHQDLYVIKIEDRF